MGWVLLAIVLVALTYGYSFGYVRFYTTDEKQKHVIILDLWLDVLADVEKKKIYGDKTEEIVKMVKHGFEQMAFDVAGYEALVNLDNKQRLMDRPKGDVKVAVGKKPEKHQTIIETKKSDKRLSEVFTGDRVSDK